MRKFVTILTVMLIAFAGLVEAQSGAQQVYATSDGAYAVRIHNTGSDVAKIYIYGDSNATNKIVIGSTMTLLNLSGTLTVADLVTLVEAATNSSSQTPLECDTKCVVATTESIDDELTVDSDASGYTIRPGDWGGLYWDTSDTAHYDVYVPPSDKGAARGEVTIKSLYGSVGGTGNITIVGYLNQVEKYRTVLVSPIYVLGAGNTNASDDVTMGSIDIPVNLHAGMTDAVLIRATRATTGTTGGMGVRVEKAQ